MATNIKKDSTSDWVPPDGGYGWVIIFASFLLCFMFTSYCQLGIFMLEFVPHLDMSLTESGWLNAMQTVPGRFIGLFMGALLVRTRCWIVALAGTVLLSGGYFLTAFIKSAGLMYLTYGLLPSFGAGCFFNCAAVAPPLYFDKKRSLACGIAISGYSCGYFAWPPIGTALIARFGYRNALLVEAAIIFVAGMLSSILLFPHGKCGLKNSSPDACPETIKAPEAEVATKKTCCQNIPTILDARPMKNPVMVMFWIGSVLSSVGYMSAVIYAPVRSQLFNIDKDTAALHASVMAICAGISSLLFAAIGNIPCSNRGAMFCAAQFGAGLMAFLSVLHNSSDSFYGYGVIAGIFQGMFQGVELPILVDINGLELLPAASGWYVATYGVSHLVSHPLTGWLFDTTQNPNSPFYLTGAAHLCAGFVLLYVPIAQWKNNKLKNTHTEPGQDTDYHEELGIAMYI